MSSAEEKTSELFVSVIIPARGLSDYLRQAVLKTLEISPAVLEIIVLPDASFAEEFAKTRVIATGPLGPAEKRDLAVEQAKGEILAFLDDDAYPSEDWLKNALPYFKDPQIAAVCGPGVTPAEDNIFQKASGWVSASLLGGGGLGFRFLPGKKKEVKDFPSMNFLVRKSDFEAAGGFDSGFWPGEDTKLCLDLTKKLGKKIIYDPKVFVYHHRRPLFKEHLEQNCAYGLHRGYFSKILPETSRKAVYFVPMVFAIFILAIPVLAIFAATMRGFLFSLYFKVIGVYAFLLFLTGARILFKEKNLKIAILTMAGIFLTHIFYGLCFFRGLLVKDLKH
ncbi:MAG: glycosyltransferase [bacterium]|nr:glycosyltransferase [bacterium]